MAACKLCITLPIPGVGMVQTRWTHLNRDYSFLTQVEAILLDGHFRSRARRAITHQRLFQLQWDCRHVASSRRLTEAGGWQHDTLTEDTDLSYRAQMKGWKFQISAGC